MPRMTASAWKTAFRAGEAPHAIIRKQYVADQVKAEDGDSRKIEFTISTGAVDRDNDTVKAEGWNLEAYRKNPVVLWAHQSRELPIGKAEAIRVAGGALKARAEFASPAVYPFAETVYQMLKGGFLKATSVGFLPEADKAMWNETRGGFDFAGQELLEFSVVPVPANPEALMDAKAAGIDLAPLKGWAERTLDEMSDEPGLWVPKAKALEVFKALSEPRITVPAFEPGPYVASAKAALEKRGRVLSQANEDRIMRARDGAEACMAALDEVMSSMPMEESADPIVLVMPDAPPMTASAQSTVPLILEPPSNLVPSEPVISIDPKELEAVVVAATREAVRAEYRRATGRLD